MQMHKAVVTLDDKYVQGSNKFFGDFCKDDTCIKPTLMEIPVNATTPQLSTFQVFNALSSNRRTATGPDGIPFWVWREHADILTPRVEAVWNLSLSMQQWPHSWKETNVNPLPKVNFPGL